MDMVEVNPAICATDKDAKVRLQSFFRILLMLHLLLSCVQDTAELAVGLITSSLGNRIL